MAYHKHTFATGYRADGSIHTVQRGGHWQEDARQITRENWLVGLAILGTLVFGGTLLGLAAMVISELLSMRAMGAL